MKKYKQRRKLYYKPNINDNILKNTDDNEYFIFSPMNSDISKQNKKAHTDSKNVESNNFHNNVNNNIDTNKNKEINVISDINNIIKKIDNFIDNILNEDFLILALIAIIIYERFEIKKTSNDKEQISEYDLMLAMLIYLLI